MSIKPLRINTNYTVQIFLVLKEQILFTVSDRLKATRRIYYSERFRHSLDVICLDFFSLNFVLISGIQQILTNSSAIQGKRLLPVWL